MSFVPFMNRRKGGSFFSKKSIKCFSVVMVTMVVFVSFCWVSTFSAFAVDDNGKYILTPSYSSSMYEGTTVDVYEVTLDNGAYHVITLEGDELYEDYYDYSQVLSCYPFSSWGEIYYESVTSLEVKISIPFHDSEGRTFDSFKIDRNNLLNSIDLDFMLLLRGNANGVNYMDYTKRSLDFSIVKYDGTEFSILRDDFDTVSNSINYNFKADNINIPVADISHFYVEFAIYTTYDLNTHTVYDVVDPDALFKFGYLRNSSLTIINDDTIVNNVINNANNSVNNSVNKADGVIGELNALAPKPDVDFNDIDTDGLSQIGKYFDTENTVMVFCTSLAVSSLGVATIGYILHGKKG